MKDTYYLGDGAYVRFEYGEVVLYTSNGIERTNRVVLDFSMLDELFKLTQAYKTRK